MCGWSEAILRLIERASTDLPADVERSLRQALAREAPDSAASQTLQTLLDNVALARERRQPLCQDTGTLLFWIEGPAGFHTTAVRAGVEAAVADATRRGFLRPNSVDPVSGANSGTNVGPGSPVIHWETGDGPHVTVALMLKGGGCENVGRQYALPCRELDAARDLEGVRRCLLDAVHRAQGLGCAPGILGVCIGGDRATGYAESKRQLLRPLGLAADQPEVAALEQRVLEEANRLGVGPMGLGGATTLLGVAAATLNRVPASFFVSVSYMCWACRRHALEVEVAGGFRRWLT